MRFLIQGVLMFMAGVSSASAATLTLDFPNTVGVLSAESFSLDANYALQPGPWTPTGPDVSTLTVTRVRDGGSPALLQVLLSASTLGDGTFTITPDAGPSYVLSLTAVSILSLEGRDEGSTHDAETFTLSFTTLQWTALP